MSTPKKLAPKGKGPSPLARAAEKPTQPGAPDMAWQAENDARKLMDAHEVHSDKKRHSAAMAHLGKQKKKITSVQQLKQLHNEMAMMPDSDKDGE